MPTCDRCGRGPVATAEFRRVKTRYVCLDKPPCELRRKMRNRAHRMGLPRLEREIAAAEPKTVDDLGIGVKTERKPTREERVWLAVLREEVAHRGEARAA